MADIVVVGAGVAGLACAALARMHGLSVTVIEAGPNAGGLWRSTPVALAGRTHFLDQGLRLPVASGIEEVDRAIFHRADFRFGWTVIDGWPREGGITRGQFNTETSCLDATVLGPDVSSVQREMREAPLKDDAADAYAYSLDCYGGTLTGGLVNDAVMGLFETDLASLESSAVSNFIPRRILLADRAGTAGLLEDKRLAGRVAHARHADLPSGKSRQFLFPESGGISTWVGALKDSLAADGVSFVFSDGLRKVHLEGERIATLELKSGRTVDVDHCITTIPSSLFGMAVGAPPLAMPTFRHLCVSHVLLDRPPEHDVQYLLNFNRKPSFFRAVFHDNLGDVADAAHIVTFEHLVADADDADHATKAVDECLESSALASGTKVLDVQPLMHRNTIPVPTIDYGLSVKRQRREFLDPVKNLDFVGRASGGGVFLDGIINEAVSKIGAIAGVKHV